MPGKAEYWKFFLVQGMLAVCQIAGCTKPNVSLGHEPKAGEKKKRISKDSLFSTFNIYLSDCFLSATGAVTNHLMKNHKQEWAAYCETRARTNAKVIEAKEEKKEACEMENSEVRFYDVRSSKGRLPFLQKVGLCYLFLSFLLCFLFRCFLTFLSPQCTGLRRTQELKQHILE